jgi:hypothetical protein
LPIKIQNKTQLLIKPLTLKLKLIQTLLQKPTKLKLKNKLQLLLIKKLLLMLKMPKKLLMLKKLTHQSQPIKPKRKLHQKKLLLSIRMIVLENQDMITVSIVSLMITLVVSESLVMQKLLIHTMDGQDNLFLKEIEKTSPTETLMRRSMVSLEMTRT